MKYLKMAFLILTFAGMTIVPKERVHATDGIKQSYQTATLSENVQPTTVVDDRIQRLQAYLSSKGSPMADAAEHFIKEADRLGMDWKLVVAIAGNESYFGVHIPYNSYNGWGWAVWTGTNYGANFQNWEQGITTVSEGLKENYINHGLTTVEQIGRKYAADWGWSWKVQHFMNEIESFDPYAGRESRALALSL